MFAPFNLEIIEVRHHGRGYGRAVPHLITRHAHLKARPETPEPVPALATGIAYLQLVADAHHQHLAHDERIGFQAIYSQLPGQTPTPPPLDQPPLDQPALNHQQGDGEQGLEVSR